MVGGLDFNVVVSDSHQVGDGVFLKHLMGFEEGVNLPLLILMRIQLFIAGPRANDGDALFKFGLSARQEAGGTHLDPALRCVGNDKGHIWGELLRLLKYSRCSLVEKLQRLHHVTRDHLARINEH